MEENTGLTSSSSRIDRKIIERNRRKQMKFLYSKLKSLVDQTTSTEMIAATLPDQLDETVEYIKKLQMKLEKLRERKERLVKLDEICRRNNYNSNSSSSSSNLQVQVEIMGDSVLEVVVVVTATSTTELGSMDQYSSVPVLLLPFAQAIQVLQQEFCAEVVNATYSTLDQNAFYTMHCKVGDNAPPGYGAARISQRLQKLFTNTTTCVDNNNNNTNIVL